MVIAMKAITISHPTNYIMLKKLVMFTASALFSLSASAGYVQYDFSSSTSANASVSGYFVQRDDDESIAFFDFRVIDYSQNRGASFYPRHDDGSAGLSAPTTTYFRKNGPTNFSLFSNYGSDQSSNFSIDFSRGTAGAFNYVAHWDYHPWTDGISEIPPTYSGTVTGSVTKGTLAPGMAQDLDGLFGSYMWVYHVVPTYISPAQVPEPASLALFAIGAIGAASAARRRKNSC